MHQLKSFKNNRVLLDAGPIIGLYNDQDVWHERCKAFFAESKFDYITTLPVITECIFKIQKDKNLSKSVSAVVSLLHALCTEVFGLYQLSLEDLEFIKQLRQTYKDQKLDFADFTLVATAETLNLRRIVTIDCRDFELLKMGSGKKHFHIIEPDVKLL